MTVIDQSCNPIVSSRHANTNSWMLQGKASDLIIKVGCISYALHKAPILSKCGLFRMLVAMGTKEEASKVDLEGIPGGANGFELAAKFCYGMLPEINKHNVALLRCVAEFLDMSEDEDQEPNLISLTEGYLHKVMSKHTFKDVVTVLHSSETLLPLSEDVGIVSQCIESIVSKALNIDLPPDVKENQNNLIIFQEFQHNMSSKIDWWVEDLSMLDIHFFQKVLSSMKTAGLKPEAIGHSLIYYAHKSLKTLPKNSSSLGSLDHGSVRSRVMAPDASMAFEHRQRILVETIVSLLPKEKNIATINFLIRMLRIAQILETTLACRLELERRIASQLHTATLDDLLIPSNGKNTAESLFDVDTVHNLVACFLEQIEHGEYEYDDDNDMSSNMLIDTNNTLNSVGASQSPLVEVGKLLDGYLAEIAADINLPLSRFISLAELIPPPGRPQSDRLYWAIDIFMKSHTEMTDIERKKICRMIEFQKLTPEACIHAAQNERLPVQAVVQLLYFEQSRIRNVIAGSHFLHADEPALPKFPHGAHQIPSFHSPDSIDNQDGKHHSYGHHQDSPQESYPASIHKISNGGLCGVPLLHDHYTSVRIENRELKLEVARMKIRLNVLEKGHLHLKYDTQNEKEQQHDHHHSQTHRGQEQGQKPPHQRMQHHQGGFFHAFSKSLSRLNPFHHHKLAPAPTPLPPQSSSLKHSPRSISMDGQMKGWALNTDDKATFSIDLKDTARV